MNTIDILINGKPAQKYFHEGRWFLEARKGSTYEIKLKNNSYRRVVALVSVDGLSVLDGKIANNDSSGYIINAYGSTTIKGYRVSSEQVNLFQFSDKNSSYALKGSDGEKSTRNCGVIGVRMYYEKEKPIQYADFYEQMPSVKWPKHNPAIKPYETTWGTLGNMCIGGDASYSASIQSCNESSKLRMASLNSFDMGTKFSDKKVEDKVIEVEFEREELAQEIELFYASRKSLEKMGISFNYEPKIERPKAFKDSKYCQPPK